jgi:hypothetical protein
MPKRSLATAPTRQLPAEYKEKSFKEAWCSDSGAYPVMGVIAFAIVFSLGYGFKVMFTDKDSRLSKSSRKSFFRGDLLKAGEGYDGKM